MTQVLFKSKKWEVNYTSSQIRSLRMFFPSAEVRITSGSEVIMARVGDLIPLSPFTVGFKEYFPMNLHIGNSRPSVIKNEDKKLGIEKAEKISNNKPSPKKSKANDSIKVRFKGEKEEYILDYSEEDFWAAREKHSRRKVTIHYFFENKKVRLGDLTVIHE